MIIYTEKQLVKIWAKYKHLSHKLANKEMKLTYDFLANCIIDLVCKFKPKDKVKKRFLLLATKWGYNTWC